MSDPANVVPIKSGLCAYHRAAGRAPWASCEPGVCAQLTNELEQDALLESAYEISESLVKAIEQELNGPSPTIVGSRLAAALTIRLLVVQVRGDLINPMWVPDTTGAKVGS